MSRIHILVWSLFSSLFCFAPYTAQAAYFSRDMSSVTILNSLASLVRWMVIQGVPKETVILILALPIIATVVAFGRQVLGVRAFGIYTPSIVALAFLATGIKYGIVIFLVVLAVGTIFRLVLRQFRLLYLPRMAIVLTIVSASILAMFALGAIWGKSSFIVISIFPILIMMTLVEKFVTVQIEKGVRLAFKLSAETLVIAIVSFYIVSWPVVQDFIFAYPESLLLLLVANIALGRWTGLRLTEYIRFREVIKYARSEKS